MKSIEIPNIKAIDKAARELVYLFVELKQKKIAFSGEIGAGKTTLIKSICKELGVESMVLSPTFALINEYFTKTGASIFHFDLYRIEKAEELYDFGYEEYFYSDDYCFIEWPEKASELLPEDILVLTIKVNEDGSRTVFSERG